MKTSLLRSMKAPHMMTKLLPPIFLFHFATGKEFFFQNFCWPFFQHRVTFGPPNPLFDEKFNTLSKTVFDSTTEAPWCPEHNAKKTSAPYTVPFLRKIQTKKLQTIIFFCRFGQQQYFLEVFLIELRFFVSRSVHQDASFELSKTVFTQFIKFFIIKGVKGVQNIPNVKKGF